MCTQFTIDSIQNRCTHRNVQIRCFMSQHAIQILIQLHLSLPT
ncbi:Uncharacterised protein [Vibrio cholerae]|nr:Uncharacterised protein [Vibrio cholerae]CSI93467.1 Uncharacterised protein [Vibrio cholerae]